MKAFLFRLLASSFCCATLISNSSAAILVYEGFNGYGTGALNTVAPNGNTIGLNTVNPYAGTGSNLLTLSATGISFSNLATSGGSILAGSGATSVGAAALNLSGAHTGTLYNSYLINVSAFNTASGNGAQTRVSDNNSNGNERFRAEADSRTGTNTNAGVAYDAGATVGTATMVAGVDYLVISRFTNVGNPLSGGSPGVGTIYILTASQFDSFVAAGRTDNYLDTATEGSGASQITARATDSLTAGTYSFTTGNFVQFLSVNTAARYDELRYGTTLHSVTPVPEPGTWGICLMGVALLAIAAGRRRAFRKSQWA